jgi:hypothetical protein
MGWIRSKLLGLLLCFLLSALSFQALMAQNLSEWVRQKKTQNKYLLEQIVALRMYAGYLQKGYEVARSGLGVVRDLSKGEFNLHSAFISGLKKVNPSIGKSVRVAEILEMQFGIGKAFRGLGDLEFLSVTNRLYVDLVRANLWEECLADLKELLLVLSSGRVEMKDDERLERLDRVYGSMREKSSFAQHFCSQVMGLADGRREDLRMLREMGGWYGF